MQLPRLLTKPKRCSVVRSGICGCINAQETVLRSDVRLWVMPGLPTHLAQELNASTVCGRIYAQETRLQSDMRLCIETPGLPTHLVQELNAVTVCVLYVYINISFRYLLWLFGILEAQVRATVEAQSMSTQMPCSVHGCASAPVFPFVDPY